ncbi:MAG: diacylglycerol kinase [Gammaproteobacteria bacterium]|nr:diacylglycerol kinase [Gammaproteobacteria bacterium]
MAADDLRGIPRLIRAARCSFSALRWGFVEEEAVRLEMLGVLLFAPLAFWLGNTDVERALLIGSLLLILMVELLNTGIEVTIDRISHEHHELSGRAKDLGSAAVFVSLVNAAVIWGLILFS